MIERFGLSIRRACKTIGFSRTSYDYRAKEKPEEAVIRARMKELAQVRRRFGCPRVHVMLRREGFAINHKRTDLTPEEFIRKLTNAESAVSASTETSSY